MSVDTFLDGRVTMHVGDVFAMLQAMEPDSVDCVVTSPPYWGLRSYIADGDPLKPLEIGLEPTLGQHLDVLVRVFEEVKRVLKPSGTLWINYGDCYATTPNGRPAAEVEGDDRTFRDKPFSTVGPIRAGKSENKGNTAGDGVRRNNAGPIAPHGKRITAGKNRGDADVGGWGASDDSVRWRGGGVLKAKDLCMVPNRLAIALQEAGWWVRAEIVWGKNNPMPSSVRDRPATAHEKIFMLSKSARYFYDGEAVKQGRTQDEDANGFRGGSYVAGEPGKRQVVGNKRVYKTPDGWDTGPGGHGTIHRNGRQKGESVAAKRGKQEAIAAATNGSRSHTKAGFNARWDEQERQVRRARDEAGAALPPNSRPHSLTEFESKHERNYDGRNLRNYEPAPLTLWEFATAPFPGAHFATFPPELAERCILAGSPKGGLVLDPFGGAGTTALVALRHGRLAALIELNPEYAEIARARIEAEWRVPPRAAAIDHGPLFSGRPA